MSLHRRSLHRPAARRRLLAVAGVAAFAVTGVVAAQPASATAAKYSVQTLHFLVHVGPHRATACDIVGQLYLPAAASPTHRVPAILTTNGFGGSDADQAPFAEREATHGYGVLSYSGLGFGASACPITLDDPSYDGVAASQLVTYLGGGGGIAFTDSMHAVAAPRLNDIVHDARDHDGVARAHDPRVGMWGGSYGGEIQFAAADVDPRIDALNPQITWNDLSYSLGPNNATVPGDVTVSDPGATKLTWGLVFSSVGVVDGVQYASSDPERLVGCPNFAPFVCPALVTGGTTGYFQPSAIAAFRHASVESYVQNIKIPVLLDQGEDDTLFNLNEAVTTYKALRAQGTPVSMMWRLQGHSGGTPSAAGLAYENSRIQSWFNHYLKGRTSSTGPRFAYYRDWTGTFAQSNSYPVGSARNYYLSGGSLTGGGDLVDSAGAVASGSQSFTTPPFGPPTTLSDLDALGAELPAGTNLDVPDTNVPGTCATWQTPALTKDTDVVGSPQLTIDIDTPTATGDLGPAGQTVLFAKVYDVAPDGTESLIHGLVAPFRVADPSKPVHVTLPGIAHRFPAGDRIRLVVAGGDTNYRGGLTPTPVTIASSGSSGQVLSMPVAG